MPANAKYWNTNGLQRLDIVGCSVRNCWSEGGGLETQRSGDADSNAHNDYPLIVDLWRRLSVAVARLIERPGEGVDVGKVDKTR